MRLDGPQDSGMPDLDRTRLVEQLERLGATSNEEALSAAREADRLVAEAGSTWREVIGGKGVVEAKAATTPEPVLAPSAGDPSGDLRTVERLLARTDVSDTLRSDLQDFKRALAEGKLEQMDSDYLRALAKRLGA